MSGTNPVTGAPAAADPNAGQQSYGFSARVLLMGALLLVVLAVVLTLIRVLLYLFVVRPAGPRRRGLRVGILRSISISSAAGAGWTRPHSPRCRSPRTGSKAAQPVARLLIAPCACRSSRTGRRCGSCRTAGTCSTWNAWTRGYATEAELPEGSGKGEASSSSASEPALFGAGGTLVVTVHGVSGTRRDVPVPASGSGQPGSSYS
ncbi:unnamed protein product [Alopecurus aequalis]